MRRVEWLDPRGPVHEHRGSLDLRSPTGKVEVGTRVTGRRSSIHEAFMNCFLIVRTLRNPF